MAGRVRGLPFFRRLPGGPPDRPPAEGRAAGWEKRHRLRTIESGADGPAAGRPLQPVVLWKSEPTCFGWPSCLQPLERIALARLTTAHFAPPELDNNRLANLCGAVDQNLRLIETNFEVRISRRGENFKIEGEGTAPQQAAAVLQRSYQAASVPLSGEQIQLTATEMKNSARLASAASGPDIAASSHAGGNGIGIAAGVGPTLRTRKADLQGRSPNQHEYLKNILGHDITFGIGPAGTGKTFLAVACAADALERDAVQRIVLTRPAVEAGERLGFLPGDLSQKVDPYLRPLYDALNDLIGYERVAKLFERQSIEIAPLAYMRGRTLSNSFIILDEAQNTTPEQMKMFLTRIGFGSKAVVTGDVTQIDLPKHQPSGLVQAERILKKVRGIAFTHFNSTDVVRHPLVARIVDAYERSSKAADKH
jgi:phosphate starvation-inducible protein PhoH and related proteins